MIMIIHAFVCIFHVSLSIHFTDRCEYFTAVSTKALSYLELIVERCSSLKITSDISLRKCAIAFQSHGSIPLARVSIAQQ